jgi:hypothetical protein
MFSEALYAAPSAAVNLAFAVVPAWPLLGQKLPTESVVKTIELSHRAVTIDEAANIDAEKLSRNLQ